MVTVYFSHLVIRPSVQIDKQSKMDMLWIRDKFLMSQEDFGRIVVYGHTIYPVPKVKFNSIGIDTGAWMSDVLTCFVIDDHERYFLST
jgi:serine/threonine protein phosphatase 1